MTVVIHGKRFRFRLKRQGRSSAPPQRAAIRLQRLALAASSLIAPCALIAFTLTLWSIAAEMSWTSRFFVARGLFSHWQSWLAASSILLLVARALAQYAGDSDTEYQ